MRCHHYCEILACVLGYSASLIVGMEFTIESCIRGHRFFKEFCTPKERGGLSVNARKVIQTTCHCKKTDGTKTVQSKSYNDLLTFQLHLIINLVLTQRKLAHGPVKFPARSISHFAMNIIMAKNWFNRQSKFRQMTYFQQSAKYLPAKISGHTVYSCNDI